ncbi:hypothetical protein L596_023524 [Steinernema carpocapsae]|nr:hypothetical protein L596_023524 [Steinernema carpocapsae]
MMDRELLKQREDFKKHASKNVSVQQRPSAPSSSYTTYKSEENKKKKKKATTNDPQISAKSLSEYNKSQGLPSGPAGIISAEANSQNFSLLAKIVDYMKRRHLEDKKWGLTLREILEELQLDAVVNKRQEAWLEQFLPQNHKLTVDETQKLIYRPPHKVKNRQTLLQLLQKYEREGKGGILLSELNECMPNVEKYIQQLGNQVIAMPTQHNKRKDQVFFYNNPDTDFTIDEDYQQLWRSINVDHLDEKKIEEYLSKHGILTMKDLQPKRLQGGPPKRKTAKRKTNQRVHNEHLSDVLQDYEQG